MKFFLDIAKIHQFTAVGVSCCVLLKGECNVFVAKSWSGLSQ
jgi:hypothetical protein